MPTLHRPLVSRRAAHAGLRLAVGSAAAGASWMALVAATTLGLEGVQRVRAEVSVGAGKLGPGAAGEYRLIVQSYSAASIVDGVPRAHARPLASTQRSVTPAELAQGVAIDVVDFGERARDAPVLVAWLEPGGEDLEFDGRRARPGRDGYRGVAYAGSEQTHIVLSQMSA